MADNAMADTIMTDSAHEQELEEAFRKHVESAWQEDVMAECLSMLRSFGLTPNDLYFKYEAFLLSRPSGLRAKLSKFNLDVARELRKELQRESQAKVVPNAAPASDDSKAGIRKKTAPVGNLGGFLDGLSTPVSKPKPTNAPSQLSNTGNNANLPSPVPFLTPSRTPTGPTASSYRPGAGPSRLAPPASSPLGKSSGAPSSPVSGSESPSILISQPPQPFRMRSQPHTLLETLNGHLSASTGAPVGSKPRVQLSNTADPRDWDYRYMFEKISARSEALDDQIDEFGDLIMESYGLEDLGDPHLVADDSIYTVGRILCPPTDTQKVNLTALLLESSRMLGGGKAISLRFAPPGTLKVRGGAAGVRGFGVFPGCLVCVKGKNGGGDTFVVEEVLMPPPSALPMSLPSELAEFQQSEALGGLPVSVHVAAGPYTLDDNLLYEPLEALVEVVCEERPDVLILLGPFVDSAHPHVQSGKLNESPEELFCEQISARLGRINDATPATRILLVPSVRDMVSQHAAYPQGMFDKASLDLRKKVELLPNPCTISVNETVIALASTDVLFHLRKEEVFQRAEEAEPDPSAPSSVNPQGDSMANLVRHVLGQRHFYPLFPPPESVAQDVNLDVTHWDMLRMTTAPDMLILPSKLKHFSKVVDSTLCVNPGQLARAHSAGTFAKITIHPTSSARLNDVDIATGMIEHGLWDRTRSEVWRI